MYDTGSSPFQLITTQERAWSVSDLTIVDSLSGPLWWGQEITFYGFNVTKPIEFGGKALNNSKVYYAKDGLWDSIYSSLDVWGITGNAYFFENTVIIDYKNKLFRIKIKFDPILLHSDASVSCFLHCRIYSRQRRKQLTLASKQKHIAILHQTFARAWSRSSMISSIYSVPILRRTMEGVICCPASSSGVI